MTIQVECPKCDKTYRVADEASGKKLRCKACGAMIDVVDDVEEMVEDDDEYERPSRTRTGTKKATPSRSKSRRSKQADGIPMGVWIGGGAAVGVLGVIGLFIAFSGGGNRNASAPPAPPIVSNQNPTATPSANPTAVVATGPDALFPVAQVAIPTFPNLGSPRILQPSGVRMWFVQMPASSTPGHSMGMRLYLPPKDAPDQSIPCVLVAPAGSNLLVGNDMDADDYHAETLPYAEAGMAVVFYSLDGGCDMDKANDGQFAAAYHKFRAAQAGVVNGRNALEFVLAKVPQVNPKQIYTAGHSSAGTVSLLMSQHEPRLAGSIAYAACSDVETRLAEATRNATIKRLFTDVVNFVKQSSPKTHAAKTNCPVFLFHAADDSNVPLSESKAYEQLLKAAGKTIEFRTVPTGNHYNSMVQQGVPMAVQWLKKQTGVAADSSPAAGPSPRNRRSRGPAPSDPGRSPAPKNAGWPE